MLKQDILIPNYTTEITHKESRRSINSNSSAGDCPVAKEALTQEDVQDRAKRSVQEGETLMEQDYLENIHFHRHLPEEVGSTTSEVIT